MVLGEHSAILLTFIKVPFVIKIFVLSIFEWPFYTGFTVFIKSFFKFTCTAIRWATGLILVRTLNLFHIFSSPEPKTHRIANSLHTTLASVSHLHVYQHFHTSFFKSTASFEIKFHLETP